MRCSGHVLTKKRRWVILRICLRDYISWLPWEHLPVPRKELQVSQSALVCFEFLSSKPELPLEWSSEVSHSTARLSVHHHPHPPQYVRAIFCIQSPPDCLPPKWVALICWRTQASSPLPTLSCKLTVFSRPPVDTLLSPDCSPSSDSRPPKNKPVRSFPSLNLSHKYLCGKIWTMWINLCLLSLPVKLLRPGK